MTSSYCIGQQNTNSQLTSTCSKSPLEIPEKGVKYVQS